MTNKEIANQFNLLAKLMELHEDNPFKIKSYANSYLNLRKIPKDIFDLEVSEIEALPGVGKATASKVMEIINSGEIHEISVLKKKTPAGIIDMLGIKGFGPKKIKQIWKELEIESIGELLYAINENRLVDLKGFGAKTQESVKQQLDYFVESSDKHLYASIESLAHAFVAKLKESFPTESISLTGEMHRKCIVISKVSIITTIKNSDLDDFCHSHPDVTSSDGFKLGNCVLEFISATTGDFFFQLAKTSSDDNFWESLEIKAGQYKSEEKVFEANGLPFYIPEFRESSNSIYLKNYTSALQIISEKDIKGCIHNHSTYSDGVNTIEEMIVAAEKKNYEYFVLTDHSKSAFYANGLQEERLFQQLEEVVSIDQKHDNIRLFSGIESDILNNGDLDYTNDILAELDVIVASIHSNLKMDEDKATSRLIAAIENPYTSILGHPTGRLLLSRKAYPIDHKKVIDACANNYVAIEINANPARLDMDWKWIQYALEKDVLFSINPDAHSTKGIDDMYFGVCAARKGGLPKSHCLNAFDLEQFEEWMIEQHQKR